MDVSGVPGPLPGSRFGDGFLHSEMSTGARRPPDPETAGREGLSSFWERLRRGLHAGDFMRAGCNPFCQSSVPTFCANFTLSGGPKVAV